MSQITLTWEIGKRFQLKPDKHYIYRDSQPMSISNLPTSPIGEVGGDINTFVDTDIVSDNTYHYLVIADKGGLLSPAEESISISAGIGAGPTSLIAGDMNYGYFGETTTADLFTSEQLAGAVGLSIGTPTDISKWFKIVISGKILYFPDARLRSGVSWNDLYNAGLIYGVEGNGLYPTGTPTSQNVVVTSGGFSYKVRAMTGANSDPTTSGDNTGSSQASSEWNRIINSLNNGEFASLSTAQLGLGSGLDCWMKETSQSSPNTAVLRGNGINGFFLRDKSQRTVTGAVRNWRPILELL